MALSVCARGARCDLFHVAVAEMRICIAVNYPHLQTQCVVEEKKLMLS